MERQRGQSAVEFALVLPMIMLLIFGAIYGGAMFMEFMNFNNEARTVARQLALTTETERQEKITYYNSIGEKEFGIYLVKMNVWTENGDIFVRYDFNRSEFPFGFPPAHFATSYTMKIENTD